MKHYKEDPRLPANPDKSYDNFISWHEYLGKETPVKKYKTLEEASAAAIALLKDLGKKPMRASYKDYYKLDPKLPANPNRCYESFTSWSEFLGREALVEKYETLEEASAATITLFKKHGIEKPTSAL
ncbi:integrase repeat-containing protein, partial [Vibrio parahaemolyticus]|uniref:integrase repeat-containing protein n=1 Tax=Vibrio parahaemolyticus TaxID=670 RepID=UPI001E452736